METEGKLIFLMYILKKSYRVFYIHYIMVWGLVLLHFFLQIPYCLELKKLAYARYQVKSLNFYCTEKELPGIMFCREVHRILQFNFVEEVPLQTSLNYYSFEKDIQLANEILLSVKPDLEASFLNIHQNKYKTQRSPHTCSSLSHSTLPLWPCSKSKSFLTAQITIRNKIQNH